jgi:hypothetical protein
MEFTTLQSSQQQQKPSQHEELPPEVVAAGTKSAPAENDQEEDVTAITTFWNLHDEVEKLKQEIQIRDGQDKDQHDSENDQQYHEIYYGEKTGSNIGVFILPSDEDHSSSVAVDELRGGEEDETSNTPYHIFHKNDSEENTAPGNYGSHGGSSSQQGGTGSSSNSGLSFEESQLRDVLTNVKQLGENVNIAIHQKTSTEKNGINDPLRAPSNFLFYNPNADPNFGAGSANGGDPLAPPRGNDEPTNQPTSFGKRNCKAVNGSFGDNRQARSGGGIVLRFQYELSTDVTPGGPYQRASLYNEILPAVESAMTNVMLPAFFSEECMKISTSGSSSQRERGRFLRGGGEGIDDQIQLFHVFDLEEDPTFRIQMHRRLNRVIGIDSNPMDFPLNGEGKSTLSFHFAYIEVSLPNPTSCSSLCSACYGGYVPPDPNIVPKCYVMEGAMTIYFPENFDSKQLLPGAQATALNTLKEGMEFGTISEMAHPAILDLTFLERSYSLGPQGDDAPKAVTPESSSGGSTGLIAGIICVLVVFVIIAACFFRYRLKQEEAKLEAMMRSRDDDSTSKKKKKKGKKKKSRDDETYQSSNGTPVDPTSLALLNSYHDEDDADDEDNLTDRERELHARLKKRRKSDRKKRRRASNASSNLDGSFSTINTDSTGDSHRNSIGNSILSASETHGSKTTTSSDSTTDDSSSESSTTSHSNTQHTTSTGTSDDTTSDENTTTSSTNTSDDDEDDTEEDDAFDMNDDRFNVGNVGRNFTNGAMSGQRRKRKGQRSNLIMTGDDDASVGTEATGATEAMSNVNRGGMYGGGGFSGGASAAQSVDFSAATEVMGNTGKNWGRGEFSGGASAAPSVDFSAATEVMGNAGKGFGTSNWGGGGFAGGASAAPSVDFSAATEVMGNKGRGVGGFSGGALGGRGRYSSAGSAAASVDFSAATEAMGNMRKARGGSGSVGPGVSVAMSAATEAIKNTGSKQPPQKMGGSAGAGGVGDLTFSDF